MIKEIISCIRRTISPPKDLRWEMARTECEALRKAAYIIDRAIDECVEMDIKNIPRKNRVFHVSDTEHAMLKDCGVFVSKCIAGAKVVVD